MPRREIEAHELVFFEPSGPTSLCDDNTSSVILNQSNIVSYPVMLFR